MICAGSRQDRSPPNSQMRLFSVPGVPYPALPPVQSHCVCKTLMSCGLNGNASSVIPSVSTTVAPAQGPSTGIHVPLPPHHLPPAPYRPALCQTDPGPQVLGCPWPRDCKKTCFILLKKGATTDPPSEPTPLHQPPSLPQCSQQKPF